VGVANACTIDVDNLSVEVKVDGSYASTITAQVDDDVDVKMTFDITDVSGTNCPADINAKLIITRYNDNDNNWEDFETSAIKTYDLDEDDYTISWNNEFTVDEDYDYTKYKVLGIVFYDYNGTYAELDNDSATVNVEGESCDAIKLHVSDITIDESDDATKTFSIENTSNEDFEITDISVDFDSTKLTLEDIDYSDFVSDDSEEDIDISISADSVNGDYDTTGTLSVSGYLNGEYCSASEIGDEEFDVTISENDDDYSGDEDCSDIVITPRDFTMEESTTSKVAFSVKNNSTARFELIGVEVTSDGLNLSDYYFEKYLFSGQTSDIIIEAIAPAVTQDKTYTNTLRVKGMFYDGTTCEYNDIYNKTFNAKILDVTQTQGTGSTTLNCGALTISAPSYVSAENYGSFSLTIVNNTSKRADIYVEGTVDAQPTLIAIPTGTSITREVSFGINSPTGEINFRPAVEGCAIGSKKVVITNTATGSIKNTSISTTVTRDENTDVLTLSITIENNTSKVFNGIVEATAPGYNSVDRSISVSPGKNVLEVKLSPNGEAKQGKGIVSFKANGEETTTQFDTQNSNGAFAGLFSFGPMTGTIGILLIIIIIVLVIAAVILSRAPRKEDTDQKWVENKQ
jgi:hypothetical protein